MVKLGTLTSKATAVSTVTLTISGLVYYVRYLFINYSILNLGL